MRPSPTLTRSLFFCFIVALLCVPLAGYAQDPGMPDAQFEAQSEEQLVLATEDEYVMAEVNRDEATLRRMVDDRFQFNTSRGITTGKEELIQDVMGMAMVGQTVSERSVLIEGDVALIFGTTELRFAVPGEEESISTLRYTSTYVKRDRQWRMLALQMQPRAKKS